MSRLLILNVLHLVFGWMSWSCRWLKAIKGIWERRVDL